MRTFSITFPNGDFRAFNQTFTQIMTDLRFMRDKWPGITIVLTYDNKWKDYKRKIITL